MRSSAVVFLALFISTTVWAQDRVRPSSSYFQDVADPYYPTRHSPRLTTPQWVGEPGVEAVVILAIDDMRDPKRYETFLRPILRRLQKIDGRAPLSIMTNQVRPGDPLLQTWLKEGLSIECHTIEHPCPFFAKGSFARAKETYDKCVDLMARIPNNRPVAFRMPCCDSLNTPSPRFYAEIFNKTTAAGNFLSLDSSVFNVFTANDPELPRTLVLRPDGSERFRRYFPPDRRFVNYIEDYPYPYVIGGKCWQFPCVTPSDWEAQHVQKPNNPLTVKDWQAALDCTVIKQGVFCLVFHPHGWIKNDQIVELVDYAAKKYGNRVKFLNFREAEERLTKNHLGGKSLRQKVASQTERQSRAIAYVLDIDGDSVMETIAAEPPHSVSRRRQDNGLEPLPFSLPPGARPGSADKDNGLRFIDLDGDGNLDVVFSNEKAYGIYLFRDMKTGWSRKVLAGTRGGTDNGTSELPMISRNGTNNGMWVHSRSLWWSNENTPLMKDHVDSRSFNELLKDVEPQALSPKASLRSIRPRPGFKVELMAAEPLVQDPIAFAWGADGKFWVVEMGTYPFGKPAGRIKYLEKAANEAAYGKATLFLDGLAYPTGVMPWGKGVLVTCAPEIFYAEDTDGDGKADRKVVLFSGFVPGNPQHRVNTLAWGLDNWIYGANGDSGGVIKSEKTGKSVSISGRDFRFKPDDGRFEPQTGQTQFGRSRDDWGNWFGCNNSNPMYHFVLGDHYLRRNPHVTAPNPRVPVSIWPGVAPVFPISRTLPRFNDPHTANHFTSACSAIVYRDELFGPGYAGNTFVSEPVHNLIHREIMAARGVTFTSRRAADEQQSEFLASSDNWFRPTSIQTGPDGALWVADMYRHVIEHPEWIPLEWQKKLDLHAGHDKGRIYRIYPIDKKPRPIPRLDTLDAAGLAAALDSPNGWQRDMAQQLLVRRKDKSTMPLLAKTVRAASRPLARLHALCTLDGLGGLDEQLLESALKDAHPGMRRHAVRLCERFLARSPRLQAAVAAMTTDADPLVRMQLAYSLGAWRDSRAGALLADLARQDYSEPYQLAAIMSSVNRTNLGSLMTGMVRPGAELPPGFVLEKLLILANAFNDREGLASLLEAIARPRDGRYDPAQFAVLAGLLDALDRQNSSLARLRSEPGEKMKSAIENLAGLFTAARRIVTDSKSSRPAQVQAMAILGRGLDGQNDDLRILGDRLVPQAPYEIQAAAVASLGRLKRPEVASLLLEHWKGFAPGLRAMALDVLLSRPDWTRAMLDAVARGGILPMEMDAARRQRLLDHKQADIRARAARLLAETVNADRRKVVASYLAQVKEEGDPAIGAKIFTKTCAACHQLGGIGQQVGPDLASVPDKSTPALLNAILDPNQAVEARYVNYTAVTKNGLSLGGLLAAETGTSITLAGPDGKKQVLLRSDLEELASTGKSVMPEGLEKDLSPADMTHLLAFIRKNTPLPKRKVFADNHPAVVQPDFDGHLNLRAGLCEIYGKTLVFEQQYANLGYWNSPDDQAVWTVEVPRPGKYSVWFIYACHNSTAGNAFVLQIGGQKLTGTVQGTGTWDDYKRSRVGSVSLPAGRHQITMRAAGTIRGTLIDLKEIRLIPVK
jgi:putative membrane-bound dehydrogenase-like protein